MLYEVITEIYINDIHALIAGICISNESSVHLHEKFGFKQASHMKEIGWKFDQWRDVEHWQLIIKQIPPKILILCTGNSCRSQMAHGFLQSFDPKLLVYSAGTKASGEVNPKAIEVMQDAGVDISHHTSDSIGQYVITSYSIHYTKLYDGFLFRNSFCAAASALAASGCR